MTAPNLYPNTVDGMAVARYRKIQPRSVGSFWNTNVQLHTVTIDEDSVSHTVSIHQAIVGPRPGRSNNALRFGIAKQSDSSLTLSDMPSQGFSQKSHNMASEASPQTEYAVV